MEIGKQSLYWSVAFLNLDDRVQFIFFTDDNHDFCDVYNLPYCSSSVLTEP